MITIGDQTYALNDPAVLIVAPMSGHYATLLRGTVEAFLPEHEVYITDWTDARDGHGTHPAGRLRDVGPPAVGRQVPLARPEGRRRARGC